MEGGDSGRRGDSGKGRQCTALFKKEQQQTSLHQLAPPLPRSTVFVTRALMRRLAPVELLLKQTAVGGQEGAPSVLEGAVVRVLIDKVRGSQLGLGGWISCPLSALAGIARAAPRAWQGGREDCCCL